MVFDVFFTDEGDVSIDATIIKRRGGWRCKTVLVWTDGVGSLCRFNLVVVLNVPFPFPLSLANCKLVGEFLNNRQSVISLCQCSVG